MGRVAALARSAAGGAGGAIAAQLVTAGGSFLLQVLAARSLGPAGYGRYALCVAVVVTVTAVQTGWVGDSLTVLDRHDRELRRALATCLALSVGLGLALGTLTGLLLGLPAVPALLLGGLLAGWLVEESGRRLLMARLEFWRLVLNDCGYLLVTLLVLAAAAVGGVEPTLGLFLGAMAAGASAAVLLALVQLPKSEWTGLRPGLAGLRRLAAFAAWRSAQAGLRPAALLTARLLVLNLVSAAAVGGLEAARLLVAPAQTVINGAGSFLLPTFAKAERAADPRRAVRRRSRRYVTRAAWLLGTGTVGVGLVSLVFLDPLSSLVTGGDFAVSPVAFLGWTAYVATWAVTLPYVSETVARQLSRQVFRARAVDSLIGVLLSAAVLAVNPAAVDLVPWLLAAGGVVGVVLLRRLAVSSRPEVRHAKRQPAYLP
jgi:O-antigen/teichoic acid export membrane protein